MSGIVLLPGNIQVSRTMKSKKSWAHITITNLCIVAVLGLLLRSKAIFDMPWLDYNRLVDTHGHFAFMGWATLSLLSLMVFELPGALYAKPVYRILLTLIALCSWTFLLTDPFTKSKSVAEYISITYILASYVFAIVFIRDVIRSAADRSVKLLSVSSVIYLVLSSAGVWILTYLFAVRSLNAILYRDALFGYLHMQYNGFFTLAIFALIFNRIGNEALSKAGMGVRYFAWLLSISVIPSMFITFLWHETNLGFRMLSISGAIMLVASFVAFIITDRSLRKQIQRVRKPIRYLVVLFLGAFMVKIMLQSFTIFDSLNVLVFGNRSIVMGFLHMVFLGFVTLFIIALYAQNGILNANSLFTRIALGVFTIAIATNEVLLAVQGFGTMLMTGSLSFLQYLWIAGIMLVLGAFLIAIAAARSSRISLD